MTDRLAGLNALIAAAHPLAQAALARFYDLFADQPLVLDKWFALQARAPESAEGSGLQTVRQLMRHRDFSLKNPNRARALVFTYCMHNPAAFHRPDGAGYAFWAEQVLALDALNPQVAARLARALDRWASLAQPCRSAARAAIERVAAHPGLSRDVREIVSRSLQAAPAASAA